MRRTVLWLASAAVACGGGGDGGSGDGSDTGASTGTTTSASTADGSGTSSGSATTGTTAASSSGDDSGGSTSGGGGQDAPWQPGTVYRSLPEPNPRGLLDLRGLVHTHSVYSHDACDEMPVQEDGHFNEPCFEDLRRGLCQTQHDWVMFTDHPELFDATEYPDVLLFDAARGDALLERDGAPVGNWSGCDDGSSILLLAGTEGETMPVGLEHHVDDRSLYGQVSAEAIDAFKAAGAVSLVAHTEDWTVEQLETLPLDGFEMYNLHANTLLNLAAAVQLLAKLAQGGEGLPHPDLAIMPLWSEDVRYLQTWGTVLSHGTRRVTTMGTDAHRNTFMQELQDGERIDSFRRMMLWFSNHLLVEGAQDGSWDDLALKDALRSRRLYGVFEYMGYAQGFDAYVAAGDTVVEIGGEVAFGDGPVIHAVAPTVRGLDPMATPPTITVHVLRAIEGGFEEVMAGSGTIAYEPDAPGAYRVEVRIVPLHLTEFLGDYAELASQPRPWVYANAFYVTP